MTDWSSELLLSEEAAEEAVSDASDGKGEEERTSAGKELGT